MPSPSGLHPALVYVMNYLFHMPFNLLRQYVQYKRAHAKSLQFHKDPMIILDCLGVIVLNYLALCFICVLLSCFEIQRDPKRTWTLVVG